MPGIDLITGKSWEACCEKGENAEDIVQRMFLNAGWSMLAFGKTRVNSPPVPLATPEGPIRPLDYAAFHPDGRRFYAVEVKSKYELATMAAYGMDRTNDAADPWFHLKKHDKAAGPVLFVIWDRTKVTAICATVPMLLANGGPGITNNGKYWLWSASIFRPLNLFLSM